MLKPNKEEILEKFRYNGKVLFYYIKIYKEYKNDKELILIALNTYPDGFMILNNDLKEDRDFCLKALKIQPKIFPHLKRKFKMDDEFITIALTKEVIEAINFLYLPKIKKNVRAYALISLQKDIRVFYHLNKRLRNDWDICQIVAQNEDFCRSLCTCHPQLLSKTLCEAIYKNFPLMSRRFPKECISFKLAKKIIKRDKNDIDILPHYYVEKLIDSEAFAILALENNVSMAFIPKEFRTDKVLKYYIDDYIKKKKKYHKVFVDINYISKNYILDIIDEVFDFFYKKSKEMKCEYNFIDEYVCPNLDDKIKLEFIIAKPKFVLLFNTNNSLLLEAMKINPDVHEFIEDNEFADILLNAYLTETLNTFKEDYPKYFNSEAEFLKNPQYSIDFDDVEMKNFTKIIDFNQVNVKRTVGYLTSTTFVADRR